MFSSLKKIGLIATIATVLLCSTGLSASARDEDEDTLPVASIDTGAPSPTGSGAAGSPTTGSTPVTTPLLYPAAGNSIPFWSWNGTQASHYFTLNSFYYDPVSQTTIMDVFETYYGYGVTSQEIKMLMDADPGRYTGCYVSPLNDKFVNCY